MRDGKSSARNRIITAADQLFATNGIRATGVNAIISRSGVAKATFYRHFAGKDDLVAAWASSSVHTRTEAAFAAIEGRATSPEDRVALLFEQIEERMAAPDFAGFPFLNAALELGNGSGADGLVERELLATRAFLEALGTAAGAADPADFAEQVQLLMLGLLVRVRAEPGSRARACAVARAGALALVTAPTPAI